MKTFNMIKVKQSVNFVLLIALHSTSNLSSRNLGYAKLF